MADDLVLYHARGACSQVSLCALEQTELPFRLEVIDLAKNEQSTAGHLAISPLGKVPVLLIDGVPLLENPAILMYLHRRVPAAGLLPASDSPRSLADAVSGLSFCGGTLHPAVRAIVNPARLTTGDGQGVRERGLELASKAFAFAERRLAERRWWLGEWSIIDVYLNWNFSNARKAGFPVDGFPLLNGLMSRLLEKPSFERMLATDAIGRDPDRQGG